MSLVATLSSKHREILQRCYLVNDYFHVGEDANIRNL